MDRKEECRQNEKPRTVAEMINDGMNSTTRVITNYNAALLGKTKPPAPTKTSARSSS